MHPCADEYDFIAVPDPGEAAVLRCQPGERLVVRLFADGVPHALLADGCRILARFASGESQLGVWHDRDGRHWLILSNGSELDKGYLLTGLVITELPRAD